MSGRAARRQAQRQERMDLSPYLEQVLMQMGMRHRFDAGEVATFTRQLEFIYTQTYDVLYPDLKARQLIPVDMGVDPGAELVTYRQFDQLGEAKVSDDQASDGPNAEIVGQEFKTPVRSIVASYRYSLQDLRRASMANLNLDGRKAEAARDFILRKMESLACIGDGITNGITGLSNIPGSQAVTITTKTTANDWPSANAGAGATPAQVLADVNKMQQAIFVNTKGIWMPDTLVLGTGGYAYLGLTPQSPTFTNQTILQYILSQSPWLKSIEYWPRLDTAGSGSHERMVMYKKDPRVLCQIIPQDFEQLPPQARAYSFVVNCHARYGGVQCRYPLATAYMDGNYVS